MKFQSPKYILSTFYEGSLWSCNVSRTSKENDSVKWDINTIGS